MDVSRRLSLADSGSGRCRLDGGGPRRDDALVDRSRLFLRVPSRLESPVNVLLNPRGCV